MSKTSWIIFIAVVGLLFGGLIVWARTANPPVNVDNVDVNQINKADSNNGNFGDFVKGNPESKVILIEYADFQCPSCAQAYPSVSALVEEYGDKIAFVFRNFPLASIHPNARAASGAAVAASNQNKFWEMYDVLFENTDGWTKLDSSKRTDIFASYATQIGIDKEKFLADLSSDSVNRKINFDMAIGKKKNVTATPSFFLNGEPVNDEASSGLVRGDNTKIKELIDARLAEASNS